MCRTFLYFNSVRLGICFSRCLSEILAEVFYFELERVPRPFNVLISYCCNTMGHMTQSEDSATNLNLVIELGTLKSKKPIFWWILDSSIKDNFLSQLRGFTWTGITITKLLLEKQVLRHAHTNIPWKNPLNWIKVSSPEVIPNMEDRLWKTQLEVWRTLEEKPKLTKCWLVETASVLKASSRIALCGTAPET